MNRSRYQPHGDLRAATSMRRYPVDGKTAEVQVWVSDLLEVRSGHVWSNGLYKVQLANVPGMRTKTFHGETAWSKAASYAHDAAGKCGDWRWWPDL
jgi:hypothetical protein